MLALDNLIFEIGSAYELEQDIELKRFEIQRDNDFLESLAKIVLAALGA